jgi:hypothetical protein
LIAQRSRKPAVESKFEVEIEINGRVKRSRTTSGRKGRAQIPRDRTAPSKEPKSPAAGERRGGKRRERQPGSMGQSQDPSRNEDQSAAVVGGEKLKVKCESAKSRVQEGDVGEVRSIYAGARDRQMELSGRWRR